MPSHQNCKAAEVDGARETRPSNLRGISQTKSQRVRWTRVSIIALVARQAPGLRTTRPQTYAPRLFNKYKYIAFGVFLTRLLVAIYLATHCSSIFCCQIVATLSPGKASLCDFKQVDRFTRSGVRPIRSSSLNLHPPRKVSATQK